MTYLGIQLNNLFFLKRIRFCVIAGCTLLPLFMTGCGKPKYYNDFKEHLAVIVAKSPQNLNLDSVTIKETSRGTSEALFDFSATISTSENLFVEGTQADVSAVQNISVTAQAGGYPPEIVDELIPKIQSLNAITTLIIKLVTPKGAVESIHGKGRATLNSADGSWGIEVLNVSGDTDFPGTVHDSSQKCYVEGSPEALQYLASIKAKVDDIVATAHKAEIMKAEKEAKDEAAAKKLLDAVLNDCAQGKATTGIWQSENASGKIGIRFGEHIKLADGYSFQGILFDPAAPTLNKPFSGIMRGDGTEQNPFTFDLNVTKGSGGIVTQFIKDPFHSVDDPCLSAFADKTPGFLMDASSYPIKLLYSPQDGSFSGKITQFDKYSPCLTKGYNNPTQLQFVKTYNSLDNIKSKN